MIKDVKAWRSAWEDVLKLQYDASEAFANLYKQIEPASDPESGIQPVETPAKYMQKCLGLQKEYSDEKTDLAQEIEMIGTKVLRPAEEAKQHTKLLHKTLKHRENMKLDYERYLSRAEHVRKKDTRNAKEETALATHEANLAQAHISYQTADDQVKQTFPPVTEAILSLLPYLLANQIRLQTTLVGQLYTVLDAYTRKFGFPNPAPPDTEIVNKWDSEFTSLRKELEGGLSLVANGKAVHLSMALPAEKDKNTVTGLGIRNKVMNKKETQPTGMPARPPDSSKPGSLALPSPSPSQEELAPPKPPRPGGMPSPRIPSPRIPSAGAQSPAIYSPPVQSPGTIPMPSPSVNLASKPKPSPVPSNGVYGMKSPPPYPHTPTSLVPGYQAGGGATPPSQYQTPGTGMSPLAQTTSNAGSDYFGNQRPSQADRRPSQASSIASSAASIAAAKKKPPPPVPAKRLPSQQHQFVTALYDFEGQNAGDLSFKEGDRIRVVKKTDSMDDWWDGELRGQTGAFPANYMKI